MNLVLKTSLKNIFGKPFRTLLVAFSIFVCSMCAMVCFEFATSLKSLVIGGSSLGLSKADCLLYANDFTARGLPEGFPESRVLEINTNSEYLYKDIEGEYAYVTSDQLLIYGLDIDAAVDMEFIEPVKLGLKEAVITRKFAKNFGYKVGDKLIVHDRANEEVELNIVGISANDGKNYFIKDNSAFVNRETANIISCGRLDTGIVLIDVLDQDKARQAVQDLKDYYPNSLFLNFVYDEATLNEINEFVKYFYLVFAVTFLLVIFVTASIGNRIVSERMPYVGTLRSFGMNNARTARILLLENILYALLGCIPAIIVYGIVRVPVLRAYGGVSKEGASFQTTIPAMSPFVVLGVILGAMVIECLIPLKAILKALKTSIRDIIFDNRDTAYKFSRSGLIIGILFFIGAIVAGILSKNIYAAIVCLLLSVTSLALLYPWVFKWVTAMVKKIADKKENAKWSLASVEAISRKSTVGSGVLCVTAAAMSIIVFNAVRSAMNLTVDDDYRCDVIVDCEGKTKDFKFVEKLDSVTDVEFIYVMQETVRFNDMAAEFDESFPFVAVPEEGFKYYEPMKGLTGKIEDGSIVVDDKTAKKYNINEGETVKLTFNPNGVVPIIREYKLVSVLKPGAFETEGTVFMSERDYKELFKDSPGYCLIKCEKPDNVARMIKTYAVGSYGSVETHKEMMDEQNKRNAKLNTVLISIIAIAVGMTFIGMASNQLIGFEGRKKECAVLLSTSMDKKKLSGVLFCEMLITALTASVMGTSVGVILTGIINKLLAKSDTLEINVEANPIATLLFCFFLIIAFTATVLFPIRNLKKMKIAEQIKYE